MKALTVTVREVTINTNQMAKNIFKRRVSFQTGVDILGFPVYVQHDIYQDNPVRTRKGGDNIKQKWITANTATYKQH